MFQEYSKFVCFRFGFVYFDNEEDCKKALEESQDNEYFSVAPGRKSKKMLNLILLFSPLGMGPDTRKPVVGLSNQVRHKPICSATENSG